MTREVLDMLKRKISRHLRNEARLIREMQRAYEAGELSDDEVKELNKHMVRVARSLMKRHPEYSHTIVGTGIDIMLGVLDALLKVANGFEKVSKRMEYLERRVGVRE